MRLADWERDLGLFEWGIWIQQGSGNAIGGTLRDMTPDSRRTHSLLTDDQALFLDGVIAACPRRYRKAALIYYAPNEIGVRGTAKILGVSSRAVNNAREFIVNSVKEQKKLKKT